MSNKKQATQKQSNRRRAAKVTAAKAPQSRRFDRKK
jgi:hypothetical protein